MSTDAENEPRLDNELAAKVTVLDERLRLRDLQLRLTAERLSASEAREKQLLQQIQEMTKNDIVHKQSARTLLDHCLLQERQLKQLTNLLLETESRCSRLQRSNEALQDMHDLDSALLTECELEIASLQLRTFVGARLHEHKQHSQRDAEARELTFAEQVTQATRAARKMIDSSGAQMAPSAEAQADSPPTSPEASGISRTFKQLFGFT
eukprot:GILK01010959.1.p1 GENE.GILK01010959.1~~GILK01010959.1.p1  ORF type:complete len:209 (+),score=37.90 GILK01010959.1:52-678(+)